ncbi:hypothetical protein WM40_19360 [Robbsia andropogonis]|uniref:Uncharacterized protein n=1 Tax=Robbsia andropogonis TaxID=28092 RepID=A0A0F5JW50_9BURK|nr:hypothetical protein [Robbsia andropogonis]KKB62063.1 hypothetical protein WM40_19360 [Robbsia andropogonis]
MSSKISEFKGRLHVFNPNVADDGISSSAQASEGDLQDLLRRLAADMSVANEEEEDDEETFVCMNRERDHTLLLNSHMHKNIIDSHVAIVTDGASNSQAPHFGSADWQVTPAVAYSDVDLQQTGKSGDGNLITRKKYDGSDVHSQGDMVTVLRASDPRNTVSPGNASYHIPYVDTWRARPARQCNFFLGSRDTAKAWSSPLEQFSAAAALASRLWTLRWYDLSDSPSDHNGTFTSAQLSNEGVCSERDVIRSVPKLSVWKERRQHAIEVSASPELLEPPAQRFARQPDVVNAKTGEMIADSARGDTFDGDRIKKTGGGRDGAGSGASSSAWRLVYTFQSWRGAPIVELTVDGAASLPLASSGYLAVKMTAVDRTAREIIRQVMRSSAQCVSTTSAAKIVFTS